MSIALNILGGEPTLFKKWYLLMNYMRKNNIVPILTTNLSVPVDTYIDKLDEPGNYIEASGAIEGILRKAGVVQVTDEKTIRKALKGKEIEMHSDGSYDRILGGKKYKKTMFGIPRV